MKIPPASVFLLAWLALILTGCSSNNRLVATGLSIEVTGIERASDGTVSASWQIANSNVVAYILSRTTHKIYLNGAYLGMMTDNEPLGIPASSNAGRTTKLIGGDAAASHALAEALARGTGSYRIDTQLVISIYGDTIEKALLTDSGAVPVTAK